MPPTPALTPVVGVNVVASLVAGALATFALRRRSRPGAVPFAATMGTVAVWAAAQGLSKTATWLATLPTLVAVQWTAGVMVTVFWLTFALAYTGRDRLVSGELVAALATVPAITAVTILAGDPLGAVTAGQCSTSFVAGVGYVSTAGNCSLGSWAVLVLAFSYLLVVLGAGLLVETMASSERVYADQAGLLVVGILVPLVGSLSWALGLFPLEGYDPTPASFAISGIAFAGAIVRHGFMDLVPATRRIGEAAAIQDLEDGVVIVDGDDRVLRINPAAGDLFGVDPGAVVGAPIDEVVGTDSLPVEPGEQVATFDAAGGRRAFEVTVSPITDHTDAPIGHTLVFRDVTEREQRKQQLSALNRVLRHNLRNDMNVVQGYADTLSERTTDPEAEMAEFIAEQSADLVEVGSKVRDMEKIMERPRSEYRPFDVADLIRDVVDEVREDCPQARVILDLPPDVRIRSDDLVLGTVVENLVRNAVEHNDGDEVTVEVTVTTREEWVVVAVTDDGPGIPAQEREAVVEGRETDLRHGSGLGLWVVNWGVTKLGGDLSFEDPEGGGTRVRIRVPGATTPEDESEATEVSAEAD